MAVPRARTVCRLAAAFGAGLLASQAVAGAPGDRKECGDGAALVERMLDVGEMATDVRARLLTVAPGKQRTVLQLRIRTKSAGRSVRTLIEVTSPAPRAGSLLLLADGAQLRALVSAPPDWPAGSGEGRDDEPALDWLSPCLRAEDLAGAHYAWPVHVAEGRTSLGGRSVCVVRSDPGEKTKSPYSSVVSWIDPERLVPLRMEKTVRDDRSIVRVEHRGILAREGRWVPKEIEVTSIATGCRSVLTALQGTSRARLDDRIFDPSRLGEPAR